MRLRQVGGLLFLLSAFHGIPTYGQVVATWTDTSGNYSNALNWSTLTVPQNSGATAYLVLIYGTRADTVTFDVSRATVTGLTLGPGETLQNNAFGQSLTVEGHNSGIINSFNNLGITNWGNGALLTLDAHFFNGPGSQLNLSSGASLVQSSPLIFDNFGTININHGNLTLYNYSGPGALQLVNGSIGSISNQAFAENTLLDDSSLSIGQGLLIGNFTSLANGSTLRVQGEVGSGGGPGQVFKLQGSSAIIGGNFINGGSFSLDKSSSFIVGGDFFPGFFDCTISGSVIVKGQMSGCSNMVLSGVANAGTFGNSGALQISGIANVAGTFLNAGFIQIDGQPPIVPSTDVSGILNAGSFMQTVGSTTIEHGGIITAKTFTATGGTVTVNGILDPTAVEIRSGATLQGTGAIIGNVAMGGTIMPGAPGMPGTLTILGNYEQIGNGTFDELIGANSASFLSVNGDAALDFDSLLNITLLNGYDPLGQTFGIMDYRSLVGQFSNGPSFLDDGFVWDISYGKNEIFVTAVGTPEPSSLLLLFVGLSGLAFCAHRKLEKTRHLA